MLVKSGSRRGKASGVEWVEGFVSFGSVHLNVIAYYVDGILIDTGAATLVEEFKGFFEEVEAKKVIITHDHEDHTGGAAFLATKYGIPIYINESVATNCAKKASYPFYRKFFWGKRAPFQAEEIGTTFTSDNASWQVIETPGHASDHLAFLNEATGQLFSGDLYVHPKTKLILRDESIPTIMASIKRVLTYDFEEMFCCHAGFVPDGKKAFREKLQYLKDLQGKVLDLHAKGWDEKTIRREVFPKKYPITLLSFGEWDADHIIHTIIRDS